MRLTHHQESMKHTDDRQMTPEAVKKDLKGSWLLTRSDEANATWDLVGTRHGTSAVRALDGVRRFGKVEFVPSPQRVSTVGLINCNTVITVYN